MTRKHLNLAKISLGISITLLITLVTTNLAHAEPENSRNKREEARKSLNEKSRWLSYNPFTLSDRGRRNNTTDNSNEPETTSTELTRDSLIAPVLPRVGNSPLGVRPPIRIPYRPPLRSPYRPPWP